MTARGTPNVAGADDSGGMSLILMASCEEVATS